jgi:hypothetical protein
MPSRPATDPRIPDAVIARSAMAMITPLAVGGYPRAQGDPSFIFTKSALIDMLARAGDTATQHAAAIVGEAMEATERAEAEAAETTAKLAAATANLILATSKHERLIAVRWVVKHWMKGTIYTLDATSRANARSMAKSLRASKKPASVWRISTYVKNKPRVVKAKKD